MHTFMVKVDNHGRFLIPSHLRKEMGIMPGKELSVRMENGELRVFTQSEALKRLRESVKKTKGHTDDFLDFRRKDGEI